MASLTETIKAEARALGFDKVGIAPADHADPQHRLQSWITNGYAADMHYMTRSPEDRADPRRLVEGAQSVIALSMSYYTPGPEPEGPRVSRYARGADYHNVIRKKIRKLRRFILTLAPDAKVKPTVDTSPVLEREWAERAGIAWIGKSTMAIGTDIGTYTFLATLITDLSLEYDSPHVDRCGTCTACLDACPTDAFVRPYVVDSNKCITYWNVETREAFTKDTPDLHGWVAGCDICQEVCPWNKFAKPTAEPKFAPRTGLLNVDASRLAHDEDYAGAQIKGTALQRTGAKAMARNARRVMTESTSD